MDDEAIEVNEDSLKKKIWAAFQKFGVTLERASQPWPKDDPGARVGFHSAMDIADGEGKCIELPGLAVEFVAQALTTCDLMEHGGSVGGSWLRPEGKVLLAFLQVHPGPHDVEGPVPWAISCDTGEPFTLNRTALAAACLEMTRE